jgi:hypothetical protein
VTSTSSTISVETENAGTYPEVDEAQLVDLTERLADGMQFLIVHDSVRPNEYAQAAHSATDAGAYVIEYQTSDDRHYQASVATPSDVGRFLAAWAWQQEGWHTGYAWKELQF